MDQIQQENKSVDDFLMNENFIVKKNSHGQDINWDNFDTIIFDADETIWKCVTKDGDSIAAYQTTPPYKITEDNNVCEDSDGNYIIMKDGFIDNLNRLKSMGKSLFICSHSEDTSVDESDQPVSLLLNEFGIYNVFDDVIIDGNSPKSEYIEDIRGGDTIFVDDDLDNLSDVANNTIDVVPLDATKITFEANKWYSEVVKSVTK